MNTTNPEQTIFVVVAFGGRYEEAWESNQIATFDKSVAISYIAQREGREKVINEKMKLLYSLREAADREYIRAHGERPEIKPYEEIPYSKWESVAGKPQVITEEMREERNVIKAQNEKIRTAAFADYLAYGDAKSIADGETINHIRESLGLTKDEYDNHNNSSYKDAGPGYRIEILEVLQPK